MCHHGSQADLFMLFMSWLQPGRVHCYSLSMIKAFFHRIAVSSSRWQTQKRFGIGQ